MKKTPWLLRDFMIKYGIKNRKEDKNEVSEDRFQVHLSVEEGLSTVSLKVRYNTLEGDRAEHTTGF